MPNELLCDFCGRSFMLKSILRKHVQLHISQKEVVRSEGLTCFECNMVFANRGLLMSHNAKIHSEKSTPQVTKTVLKNQYKHICEACEVNFYFQKELKYHVREKHFNLVSRAPYCHSKNVNQVWFEKVRNSNNIVEIKKVCENVLMMRKLDDNTAMKVSDQMTEVIDLRSLYPLTAKAKKDTQCPHCFRKYQKGYISKHIADVHFKCKKEKTDVKVCKE